MGHEGRYNSLPGWKRNVGFSLYVGGQKDAPKFASEIRPAQEPQGSKDQSGKNWREGHQRKEEDFGARKEIGLSPILRQR